MVMGFPIFYGKDMKAYSDIRKEFYEAEDCVFFRNALQSAFYYKNGAELVDLFVDSSMRFVFVFSKADHKRLIKAWMERKPEDYEERRKNI